MKYKIILVLSLTTLFHFTIKYLVIILINLDLLNVINYNSVASIISLFVSINLTTTIVNYFMDEFFYPKLLLMKPSSIDIKDVIYTPSVKNINHPTNTNMDTNDKSNSPAPEPDKTYSPSVNPFGANYSYGAYKNNTNSLYTPYLEKWLKRIMR
jgi:hypothetical protein